MPTSRSEIDKTDLVNFAQIRLFEENAFGLHHFNIQLDPPDIGQIKLAFVEVESVRIRVVSDEPAVGNSASNAYQSSLRWTKGLAVRETLFKRVEAEEFQMSTDDRTKNEAAIRDLVENWARAVRSKNIDGILANHSPDVLMFDVPPPAIEGNRGIQEDIRSGLSDECWTLP